MRPIIIFAFLLISTLSASAQNDIGPTEIEQAKQEMLLYKKMYAYADSIKTRTPGFLDKTIFSIADSLDALHPSNYFLKSAEIFKMSKYNESAFLFYLGALRYRYYNLVDPNYKESDGGALASALRVTLGEPINTYLKCNIENYIQILKESADWYIKHDYRFMSRTKNPEMYSEQYSNVINAADEIEKNKTKYQSEWGDEREEFKKQMKQMFDEINKMEKKLKHK
ncbi:hypothetical protein FFF34_018560 [Inquilinus sp. KBS0705]|nr:hypothetical protein FFF34_018560 [Inquilinus sp. KBS0705]